MGLKKIDTLSANKIVEGTQMSTLNTGWEEDTAQEQTNEDQTYVEGEGGTE